MMASDLADRLARMVEMYGDREVQVGEGSVDSVLLYDVPGVIVVSTAAQFQTA